MIFAFSKYRFKNFNFVLFLTTVALCILGYLVLGSAVINDSDGAETLRHQLYGMIGGGAFMLLLTLVDYHFWMRLGVPIYLAMLGLLGLCFTPLKRYHNGAARWIKLPGIPEVQPAEFCKVLMILFLAWFFLRVQERINRTATVFMTLLLFGIPAVMVFLEPDLSTTFTYVMIFVIMLYVANISYRWIGIMLGISVPLAGGVLVIDSMREEPLIMKQYMLNRINSFLHPDEYASTGLVDQQDRAVMAISSGQKNGKGLYNSSFESVKNGNFLSEENCDFIFAVVGEEMGFVGSVAVLGLFAVLVFTCFRTASRAPDLSGRLICVGVGAWIGLQVFINVGVTSGILPNTGVVLPFFSAGLSSLFSVFAGLGFVMNVGLQRVDNEQKLW